LFTQIGAFEICSVDVPTEKRVRKWAISLEDLISDPLGEFPFHSARAEFKRAEGLNVMKMFPPK
jgi:hypothetical protein